MAKAWLKSLPVKPKIVNIDNEIEIAAETHQDMHPKYAIRQVQQFDDLVDLFSPHTAPLASTRS